MRIKLLNKKKTLDIFFIEKKVTFDIAWGLNQIYVNFRDKSQYFFHPYTIFVQASL